MSPARRQSLNRGDILLLEEYKNCTAAMLEVNRLMWTRFNIFLAVNAGLVAAWVLLFNNAFGKEYPTNLLPLLVALLVTLTGQVTSVAWPLVMLRAQATQDSYIERLREIEESFGFKMQTFDHLRELKYWILKPYRQRRPIRGLQSLIPAAFILLWSALIICICLIITEPIVWLILIGVGFTYTLIFVVSYVRDFGRILKELEDIWREEQRRITLHNKRRGHGPHLLLYCQGPC